MGQTEDDCASLRRWWRERSLLTSCAVLLAWDEEACMPRAGAAHRAEQQALLAGVLHERVADPRLAELLAALADADLDPLAAADVREAARLHVAAVKVPRALAEELARATTLAQAAWVEARDAGEFARFAPWLARVVGLKREEAACLAPAGALYDALLDEHEPGLTAARLRPLLRAAVDGARPLVAAAAGVRPAPRPWGPVPAALQRPFVEALAVALGFDPARGRLDLATHPSTVHVGPGDARVTLRFDEADLSSAVLVTLHELGHWLYDTHLEPGRWGTPAGEALSLGLHEAQARLLENHVGRSRAFWAWCLPRARAALGAAVEGVTPDAALDAVARVAPGPVRVGADEATYDLHIAVRVDLEEALLDGRLAVGDLPGAWREAYRAALGVTPRDDLEGVLQDGHWSAGMFGYFPTYTLGNLVAAQLVEAARAAVPGLDAALAAGDFHPLLAWLAASVHRHGASARLEERVLLATGRPLDAAAYAAHLRRRYGAGDCE